MHMRFGQCKCYPVTLQRCGPLLPMHCDIDKNNSLLNVINRIQLLSLADCMV